MTEALYGDAALQYWEKGWRGILPFQPTTKWPPPNDRTGNAGIDPSYPDVMAWTEDCPDWNLGLRVPANVIGLDVDAYDERTGEEAWAEAQRRWGPLPPTVRSTARDDGISGIRLYTIPVGVRIRDRIKFRDMDIGNIETVQNHHRYCMAWPSIHPDGMKYQWLDSEGNPTGEIPALDSLPPLPDTWVEALRKENDADITATVDPASFLGSLPDGEMSVEVERALDKAMEDLSKGKTESRHDSTRDNVARLLRLGEKDEPGVPEALGKLGTAFVNSVADKRSRDAAMEEYRRFVFGQRVHDLIASSPSEQGDWKALAGTTMPERIEHPAPATTAPSVGVSDGSEVEDDDEDWGDLVVVKSKPVVDPSLYELKSIADLANIQPAEPLIDSLLYRNTLVQLSGNPGSYKTFLSISMACAVASNVNSWAGYPVKYHGPVIYIAAEGVSGLRVRILAWCQENDRTPDELDLLLLDHAVQLGSKSQVEKLIQTAIHTSAVMVVFDTRARCTTALEENSAKEQGEAIEAAERLREATDCTVVMIHHSSRSGTAGRGSNAWDGAVWSDLRVSSDGLAMKVHCEKHKDVTSGCDHEFMLEREVVHPFLMSVDDPFLRNTLVVKPASEGRGISAGAEGEVLALYRNFGGNQGLSRSKAVELADGKPKATAIYKHTTALVKKGFLLEHGTGNGTRFTVAAHAPE